ncbi:MAG: hypothetical protein LC802_07810 [Acidobacteria bacterium]|nr:hypothetical protein [Acidobacteriota bacterium]
MSNPIVTAPGVHITVEGLIALFYRKGFTGGDILACEMGAVRDAPGHVFSLRVRKNNVDVPIGAPPTELQLDVQNITQTGIRRRQMDAVIDRLRGSTPINKQSFKWVLDFEGNELYGQAIGANRAKLHPTLRIEHGELFAETLSQNHLVYRRLPTDPWTHIGIVATQVRAFIDLDQPTSEAVLKNGGVPVEATRTRRGEQLDIIMRMVHPDDEPLGIPHNQDANHYHLAIGQGLGPADIVTFDSTPVIPLPVPISPEASCLVGQMGTTEI